MPIIASCGQETFVFLVGLVWSSPLPVGLVICQGLCGMI